MRFVLPMLGECTWTSGLFRIKASQCIGSVGTIGVGDTGLIAKCSPTIPDADRYNTVRAAIFDATRDYQEVDAGQMSTVP